MLEEKAEAYEKKPIPDCLEVRLEDIQEKLIKGSSCKFCGTDLSDQPIEYYEHENGFYVEGFDSRQWLYVTCPKCRQQWSVQKLIYFRKYGQARQKVAGV